MQRRVVSFQVKGPVGWLTAGGAWGTEEEAASFSFHRTPTVLEQHAIDVKVHDLAGGLAKWAELQAGLEGAERTHQARLEAALWPDGVPEASSPQELLELEARLAAAHELDESPLKAALVSMRTLTGRLRLMARWSVLFVDGPPGWEDIAQVPLELDTLNRVARAWSTALEDYEQGKAPPSA